MVFGKENETLEFKKTTGETKEAVISIAAILNKSGKGELYFGIRNDGLVLGQQIGEATLRDVSKAISDNLKPQIFPTIDMVSIDDRYCIRVIFEGHTPPYYAYGRAYIRVTDEDKQMSPEKLESFIIRKHEQASNWDSMPSRAAISDIDATVLSEYLVKANAVGRLDYRYTDPEDILRRLGLIEKETPTNAAEVMFGKAPMIEIQMAVFATKISERLKITKSLSTATELRYIIPVRFLLESRQKTILMGKDALTTAIRYWRGFCIILKI